MSDETFRLIGLFFAKAAHINTVERVVAKMNQKKIIYLITSLIILIMSWESQSFSTVAAGQAVIPEEAIRLRILANSDSPKDQWLKREIRNKVNEEITTWVEELDDIENARDVITRQLDKIEAIVETELKQAGVTDTFTVEFDDVQFPTKLYGNYVYPAGMYEAVLITIGEGRGENWWCVLFPPLCFVDFTNGDAIDTEVESEQEKERVAEPVTEQVAEQEEGNEIVEGEEVEVRFFVVELFDNIIDGVKGLFS